MVIDASAILAILQDEPERRVFTEAIEQADLRCISTATFVEVSMIIESRFGPNGVRDFDLLLSKAQITLVPVNSDHALEARRAFREFGKGRHPAGLNYGDCFSYALARSSGDTLLYKGDDFSRTDIRNALP